MVLQQFFRSLWFSAVAILLVECSLCRFYDFVAKCFSLDSHLDCSSHVSARYEGSNHFLDTPLGSRLVWLLL